MIYYPQAYMGETQRMKRRKKRLWEENEGRCYWCGVQTILGNRGGGRSPKQYATIDHLRSRYHPARCEPVFNAPEPRTVLSCYARNNKRAKIEQQHMPIQELWRRSNSRPKHWFARLWRIMHYRIKDMEQKVRQELAAFNQDKLKGK